MGSGLGSVVVCAVLSLSLFAAPQTPQPVQEDPALKIPLVVPKGTALRLCLTRKISKRTGAPVQARLIDPIFAFDREVIPAGTPVIGEVSRLQSVSTWTRIRAALGGDFTPIHIAQVRFTAASPGGGSKITLVTTETPGLGAIYSPERPAKKDPAPRPKTGVFGKAKRLVIDRTKAQIAMVRTQVHDAIHAPDKRARLYDFLMSRLPYHLQYVRNGTRFDAELSEPLTFGVETEPQSALADLGGQPPLDSVAHARLLTSLDSATAKKGDPVQAVITAPLFSTDHRLVLPEGTRLNGVVAQARKARWLHRGGQLRFSFQSVDLPPEALGLDTPAAPAPVAPDHPAQPTLKFRTQAILQSAEASGKASLKVDDEGGVKAQESKKRLLAPVISAMIARSASDNDAGRHHGAATSAGTNTNANVGGRALGGLSGLGALGGIAAQSSKSVGAALGFYGMAWSVYSNILAHGAEVQFPRNAVVDVRFNARPADRANATGN